MASMQGVAGDARMGEHPWRLLVCDDSPVERLALSHFLRLRKFEVDEAADGRSALLHLQHRPIDLLILDLQMPEVDGFEVLNYLREHRPGLPVILLSGMPLDQIQHRMHDLTKRDLPPLLIKPIDPDQMFDLVQLQLSGNLPDSRPDGEDQYSKN
jgi:CheY-like chemotaxis protein